MHPPLTRRGATVVVGVVALVAAGGWIGAGGSDRDLDDLLGQLRPLDGVEEVSGGWQPWEDLPLGGTSAVLVTLETGAGPEEVAAIVGTSYATFSGPVRRDGADLKVTGDGIEVRLHTQGPDAAPEDLLELVRWVAALPREGEHVFADVYAMDGHGLEDLAASVELGLGPSSRAEDLLPRLASLASTGDLPPATDVLIRAGGESLGGSRGLPTEEDVATWQALRSVGTPAAARATVRVRYGPLQVYTGMRELGHADVTLLTSGRRLTDEERREVAQEHRAVLAERHERFRYSLVQRRDPGARAR